MNAIVASPPPAYVRPAFLTQINDGLVSDVVRSTKGFGLSPAQTIEKIERHVLALLAKGRAPDSTVADTPGRPILRTPDMGRLVRAAPAGESYTQLTPEAVLEMLAAQLGELFTRDGESDWRKQLDLMKERLAQRGARGEALSAELKGAESALDAAYQVAAAAGGNLAEAEAGVQEAQARVAELEARLAEAEAAGDDVEGLKASLAAATAQRTLALSARDSAVGQVADAAQGVAGALHLREAVLQVIEKALPPIQQHTQAPVRTADARLSELLAILQDIIGRSNEVKLRSDLEFVQSTLKAREAENIRRSEEYQAQVEKAERAQKKMGCIGKLIGWIVTVVAVALAPFSGGASMAVAVAMFAVAVADECGAGIMNAVMTPIIDAIMAVVKTVAQVVAKTLDAFGVDSAVIAKIKDAVAAVVVAAAVIVAVVLARKAGVDAAIKMAAGAAGRAISKVMPQIVRTAAQAAKGAVDDIAAQATKAAVRVTGSTTEQVGKRMATVMTMANGARFANQTAMGVGGVVVADMGIKAAKILADVEKGLADAKIFRALIAALLDAFSRNNTLVQDLLNLMVEAEQDRLNTASYVTSHIGRRA